MAFIKRFVIKITIRLMGLELPLNNCVAAVIVTVADKAVLNRNQKLFLLFNKGNKKSNKAEATI
jgi:hypothetical protein